ncbi:MAG TPA: hypothetical protein VGR14_21460 [Verrucomicrobiae bacterium]|nr:hypothetical protein [Verrucomicrobiae bacterium]
MTLLPVVEWELRVTARRCGTYCIRLSVAIGWLALSPSPGAGLTS